MRNKYMPEENDNGFIEFNIDVSVLNTIQVRPAKAGPVLGQVRVPNISNNITLENGVASRTKKNIKVPTLESL